MPQLNLPAHKNTLLQNLYSDSASKLKFTFYVHLENFTIYFFLNNMICLNFLMKIPTETLLCIKLKE